MLVLQKALNPATSPLPTALSYPTKLIRYYPFKINYLIIYFKLDLNIIKFNLNLSINSLNLFLKYLNLTCLKEFKFKIKSKPNFKFDLILYSIKK